jgi:hypothetical protein
MVHQHSKLTLDTMLEAEGITLSPAKGYSNKVAGPRKKAASGAAGNTSVSSGASLVTSVSSSPFLEPTCKICQLEFKSEVQSKRHYLHHFRKVFQVRKCCNSFVARSPGGTAL